MANSEYWGVSLRSRCRSEGSAPSTPQYLRSGVARCRFGLDPPGTRYIRNGTRGITQALGGFRVYPRSGSTYDSGVPRSLVGRDPCAQRYLTHNLFGVPLVTGEKARAARRIRRYFVSSSLVFVVSPGCWPLPAKSGEGRRANGRVHPQTTRQPSKHRCHGYHHKSAPAGRPGRLEPMANHEAAVANQANVVSTKFCVVKS